MSDWQMAHRNGETYFWRWCACDGWEPTANTEAMGFAPGDRHIRERVPNAPVEVCYHADHGTHVVTLLRIHSMDEEPHG